MGWWIMGGGGGGVLETEYRIGKKKMLREKMDVLTFAAFWRLSLKANALLDSRGSFFVSTTHT